MCRANFSVRLIGDSKNSKLKKDIGGKGKRWRQLRGYNYVSAYVGLVKKKNGEDGCIDGENPITKFPAVRAQVKWVQGLRDNYLERKLAFSKKKNRRCAHLVMTQRTQMVLYKGIHFFKISSAARARNEA